jgi:hypothetical protein
MDRRVHALQCFCVMGILVGVGIVQAALIRNLGRPGLVVLVPGVSSVAGLAVIAAGGAPGARRGDDGPRPRDAVPLALSVRQACRMLSMSVTDYAGSFAAPASRRWSWPMALELWRR